MPIVPDIGTACNVKGCHCGRFNWCSMHNGGTCSCGHSESRHPAILAG